MKKFVFIYKGNGSAPAGSMEETMKAWTDWFATLGPAVVDGGNPFDMVGKSVSAAGVSDVPASVASSGYTIVNAESFDEAVEMAKSCPLHTQTGGVPAVEVYEALPM